MREASDVCLQTTYEVLRGYWLNNQPLDSTDAGNFDVYLSGWLATATNDDVMEVIGLFAANNIEGWVDFSELIFGNPEISWRWRHREGQWIYDIEEEEEIADDEDGWVQRDLEGFSPDPVATAELEEQRRVIENGRQIAAGWVAQQQSEDVVVRETGVVSDLRVNGVNLTPEQTAELAGAIEDGRRRVAAEIMDEFEEETSESLHAQAAANGGVLPNREERRRLAAEVYKNKYKRPEHNIPEHHLELVRGVKHLRFWNKNGVAKDNVPNWVNVSSDFHHQQGGTWKDAISGLAGQYDPGSPSPLDAVVGEEVSENRVHLQSPDCWLPGDVSDAEFLRQLAAMR